jgi:hypothetical protein
MRPISPIILLCLCLVALGATPAQAQGPVSGSISGTVTDNTGAVLPGVTVTAASPAMLGTQTAVTNEQGIYRFPSVPPGAYKLTYELPGFTTVVREGIQVGLGFLASVNVQLGVATLQETVTVSGESPVVDTQNTTIQNNFTSEMLKSIPNARDIWSLIAEAPGMTVSRFDVGGSTAGTQTGYTAYGTGGQNRVQLDGTNTTESTGAAGFYYDYGAFEEVSFGASNAADAQMPTPGVMVNTVLKSGGNEVHGDLYFDYENEDLQGNNITPELKAKGVGEGTRIMKYFDPNFNLGGPIKKDKLWYFTSIRHQEVATTTTGWPFEAPGTGPNFLTRLQNVTYKFTYQVNQNNKFSHFLQWGRKLQPYRDAGADVSLDGVYKQDSYSWAGKVEWNRIVSPTFFFDARFITFAYNWPNFSYGADGALDGPRRHRMTDEITGRDAGSWHLRRLDRRRYGGEVVANWYRDNFLGGNHSLKFGYLSEWEQGEVEADDYLDSIRLRFRSTNGIDFSTPFRVDITNNPTVYIDDLWHHGAFVQDQIMVGPRLTINAGLRWDYYSNYQPEQPVREAPFRDFFYGGVPLQTSGGPFSLPRQSFADDWLVPRRSAIMAYPADFAPRVGVSWDVGGDGKSVLKASWGRFFSNPAVDLTDDTNPIQNTQARFGWNDRNGDRRFQMNELGPFVSLSGGAQNTVQEDIDHPFTDEANVFFERQLIPDLGVRVGYIWKKQNNQWDLQDLARPRDLWSVPFTVADRGPDGLVGTSDDGPSFTAFNLCAGCVQPSRREWQAPDDFDQTFKNVDVTINKRMSSRWSLVASYLFTWRNESWFGSPEHPNEDLNNFNDTTLWTFKLFGTYQAPFGINVSPVLRHQAGDPLPRRLSVSTNGGTFIMLVEPEGTYRETNVTIFDTRVEKTFDLGQRRRLGLFVDAFNLNNSHAAQTMDSQTGRTTVTVDGVQTVIPRFLRPTIVIAPRIFRFGVKLSF